MFLVQCEELRTNHLTPLLVVTMPYACWFLWWADYIEDFKGHLHFQPGVVFWRSVLREVYFEGSNHVWRALKTSIRTLPPSITTSKKKNTSIDWKPKTADGRSHDRNAHQIKGTLMQWSGRFLGILIGWDPSVCKSNRLLISSGSPLLSWVIFFYKFHWSDR